jgi:hypothetical protein
MGKTNWKRVFLGGLLAGVVFFILAYIADAMYLGKLWDPALEALGHPTPESVGTVIFWIVYSLVLGILAVWLYSAIRPRYGAGAKTAVIAGLAVWVLCGLSFAATMAAFGLFPANVLVIDAFTGLVMCVVATLLGAWIYKEQSQ